MLRKKIYKTITERYKFRYFIIRLVCPHTMVVPLHGQDDNGWTNEIVGQYCMTCEKELSLDFDPKKPLTRVKKQGARYEKTNA